MVFTLSLDYDENAGENLSCDLEDTLRGATFNGIITHLIGKKKELKEYEQQILSVVDYYRKEHFKYLEKENNSRAVIPGQMELVINVIGPEGEDLSLKEMDSTFNRKVVNLDKKIIDYIKPEIFTDQETGKQRKYDVLEFKVGYTPVVGSRR